MNIDWSKTSMRAIGAMVANFDHPDGRGKIEFLYSPADRDRYREGPASWEYIHAPEEAALQPWTGEGLPPVGTVCEWHPNQDGWVQVEILGHNGEETWFRRAGHESSETCLRMAFFRPIRTVEQIAAEERESAIKALIRNLQPVSSEPVRIIAAHLYEMGYRKQVAP